MQVFKKPGDSIGIDSQRSRCRALRRSTMAKKASRSGDFRRKAERYRESRIDSLARVVLEGDDMATAVTGDYLKMPASNSVVAGGPRLQPARIVAGVNGGLAAEAHTRAA